VNTEPALFGDLRLAVFYFGVVELLDVAALHAHEVIVVPAVIEFKYRLVGLEMVAYQQACLLKLRQHTIDRGKPGVGAVFLQQFVNVFGGKMSNITLLE